MVEDDYKEGGHIVSCRGNPIDSMDTESNISPKTSPYKMKPEYEIQPTENLSEEGTIVKAIPSDYGLFAWMKKLSVETEGIQRVTDADRQYNTTHVWNAATFWYDSLLMRTP